MTVPALVDEVSEMLARHLHVDSEQAYVQLVCWSAMHHVSMDELCGVILSFARVPSPEPANNFDSLLETL